MLVESGLKFPTVLLVFSPETGSNVGNLNFFAHQCRHTRCIILKAKMICNRKGEKLDSTASISYVPVL